MVCTFKKHILHFRQPAGTSRGWMQDKETYLLTGEERGQKAFGECNLFKGLSVDDRNGYENKLREVCARLPQERENILPSLKDWPSIAFGVETLLLDIRHGCNQVIFPDAFTNDTFTIPTNGLIWMGNKEEMIRRVDEKLEHGYDCIKLKIGGINFEEEIAILKYIRNRAGKENVSLRLDANGAFSPTDALKKIETLAAFDIQYIEQPIKAGQWQAMAEIVRRSPIPIALDEELIGVHAIEQKKQLIEAIAPNVLILKPALLGGFAACDEWKELVKMIPGAYCVVTSALESNIGLNAIAQYTAKSNPVMAQGLGTGQLYTNNIPAPYDLDAAGLHFNPQKKWNFSLLS